MNRIVVKGLFITLFLELVAFLIFFSNRQFKTLNYRIRDGYSIGNWDPTIHVIVERYGGQQGAGIIGLASLQCWAGTLGLNISIIEPCIRKTVLIGALEMPTQTNMFMFLGDYLDIEHINTESDRLGMARIITLEKALRQPLKKVVFVQTKAKATKILWSSKPNNSCFNFTKEKVTLIKLKNKSYCIVRIVAMKLSNLAEGNLKFVMGPYYKQRITLAISKWDPLRNVDDQRLLSCTEDHAQRWFTPSKMLLNHAKNYENRYLAPNNTVAIMIRLEHIFMGFKGLHNTPMYCFDKLTKTIEQQGFESFHPMIAADIGQHGSRTFDWFGKDVKEEGLVLVNATATLKNLIPLWLKKQFTFEQWEDSFVKSTNNVSNRGYIAALQRTIATRADCLILVGGGKFQELALKGYLLQHRDHSKWCLHFVCPHNKRILNQMVRQAKAGKSNIPL